MLEQDVIWPTENDYLKRARAARIEAAQALTPAFREQFLQVALEWERLSKAAAIAYGADKRLLDGIPDASC